MLKLQPRLPLDPQSTGRLKGVVRLFAVMLVLTLVARGTAGAAMPQVTVSTPYSATVQTTVSVSGTVTAADGLPFELPEGVLVSEVCAVVGQTVKEGDPLVRLDLSDLDRAIAQTRAELAQMQVEYKQKTEAVEADPFAAQQAQQQLDRAYERVHQTYAEGEEAVEEARENYEAAENTLRQLLAEPATAESAAEARRQEQIAAARQNLTAAGEALDAAQEQAEQNTQAANDTAQSVEDSRNSALHSLEQEEETARDQTQANRAEAGVTQVEIDKQQTRLETLEQLRETQGVYAAPYSGTVTRVDVTPGAVSTRVGGLLAQASAGSTLTFRLDKDQAALATVGSTVEVTQGDLEQQTAIDALSSPAEDDSVVATVQLPEGGWKAGAASVSLTLSAGQFQFCLPATALNQDVQGTYVYKVERRSTALGLQNVLVRVGVNLEQSGDGVVAVSGGIQSQDEIVSGTNKPLSAGTRVRVAE